MDFKVEVSFYKLQGLKQEIENLKAFIGSRGLKTGTSYDIYKLIDDNQKLNIELKKRQAAVDALIVNRQMGYEQFQRNIDDRNGQVDYLTNQVTDKETRLQLLRSEIEGLKSALTTARIEAINFKSSLAVEISNVCDLDNEKQDLIEILADKNEIITCLKAEKAQIEAQLAATIARDTSFILSGDYQVTKISKGKLLSNQSKEEISENYDTWQGQETSTWDDDIDDEPETSTWDNDIDDEPDPSIGW